MVLVVASDEWLKWSWSCMASLVTLTLGDVGTLTADVILAGNMDGERCSHLSTWRSTHLIVLATLEKVDRRHRSEYCG